MKQYLQSGKVSLIIMLICTVIFALNTLLPINLNQFGIVPRSLSHLSGIVFAPFLHGSLSHLLSNFLPFVILGGLIGLKSQKRFWLLFMLHVLSTGFLVWLFARGNSVHIGMSGVIYAFWGYLIVYGIVRRQFLHIVISVATLLFYGGLVFGVLPTTPGVSFESHLLGAIVGAVSGYYFARLEKSGW
ncbi:rhomboid family intramembrane serine protease [Psychromonas marina]|uniref:Rhomboid family intramembrane serine protease n=1 Tax=Psychromonas marina TaxID=88364 RepID=A0ABQ6DXI1_9GAMM|nr:rhomboid family intramembrane serine protease [Psychromonas marina]GLS89563.1 rhomboid family intramembrane serine protease [Psychromonas marina]